MHPHAASAAAAAEAAREQGKFNWMHTALLSGKSLDDSEITSLAKAGGLDNNRFHTAWKGAASARVDADLRLGEALGVNSTPSFVLCTPRGEVWLLERLEQIHGIVKE
jgi:protein-disulfide isomerase